MGVALSGGVALRLDQQSVETFGCCTNIMAHANIQEEEAQCEYNIALNFSLKGFLDQLVNLAEKDKEAYEREKC